MGGGRRRMLVGLAVAMMLGIAVYFRLWTIDYRNSSDDTEVLRKQFDLANKEAMDESAEWRFRYDEEAERATKCVQELKQITESFGNDVEDAANIKQKLALLQKEKMALLKRMEVLKQELEDTKLNCNLQKNF